MADHAEPTRRTASRRARRIALLSPYSGRNLGDGAVHVATIANLRALDPAVELIGLTVDTGAMLRLHGLSSATLVGTQSKFYYCDAAVEAGRADGGAAGVPLKKRRNLREAGKSTASADGSRRSLAARIPVIGPMARSVVGWLRRFWHMRNEPAHFVRSVSLARKFDLILACGGGQFDEQWGGPWSHPYTLFRWSLIARLTRTPFAMASVGVGILESKLGLFFVRRACAAATYRTFRDPGSKAQFLSWGFVRDDACVPDIVYSLPASMVPEHTPGNPKRRVGLSPMIFGREGIWPHERQGTYERYLGVLAEFTVWLMESGEEVCFFTSCADDLVAAEELWERVQRLRPDLQATAPPVLNSETVGDVLRSLATVDLAVTSRLHATVLAHRCCCPVVAISFERKVNADMEFMGHADYILDIFTVELEPLKRKYLQLAENGERLRKQMEADIRAANVEIQKQNAAILRLADGG